MLHFGKQGKLSARYIRPYEITKKVGAIAYRLTLPMELSQIHEVFHMSIFHKYRLNPLYELETKQIQLREYVSYKE